MVTFLLAAFILISFAGFAKKLFSETGFFRKWQRGILSAQRVLLEDALKYLYDREYNNHFCTLNSLAGALSVKADETAILLARLETLGLVQSRGENFILTLEGRKEALRMLRIHRLWERYLADETGLPQTEWHKRAEKLEHGMTWQETEALAAATGNPSYDPHGDPIPTATGKIPPKKGLPLNELVADDVARILHLEDEPSAVFAQLVAEGLHPGLQVRLLEKSAAKIVFIAHGEEITLAPVVAVNVTVEKKFKTQQLSEPYETLTALSPGEEGEVIGISRNCRGQQRRRMLDLGVIPGTVVKVEMRSAGGDPTAYNIRGASIALRKQQADFIRIKRIREAA